MLALKMSVVRWRPEVVGSGSERRDLPIARQPQVRVGPRRRDRASRHASGAARPGSRQSGIFTCPGVKVICAPGGGAAAIGGTLPAVIGGAPTPRGVVCTTWLGG